MVTIKDVAARAEVSAGTASRGVSGNVAVKATLRARAEAATVDLGHKPDLAARALRTNRGDILGLVLPDITNPFFAQFATEVEIAAAEAGLSVMPAISLGQPDLELIRVNAILDRSPRGLIVIALGDTAQVPARAGIRCVAPDRPCGGFPQVSADDERSAAPAADYLQGLGHRRIADIAGPRDTVVSRRREAGFTDRVAALSTPARPVTLTVREGSFDDASGEGIARHLSSQGAGRITAIAAASDQQAIGLIRAARDPGIRVPDELSVVGCDVIALADMVVPRLTTIRQRTDLMARRAVEIIPGADEPASGTLFIAELVVRRSTDRVPTAAARLASAASRTAIRRRLPITEGNDPCRNSRPSRRRSSQSWRSRPWRSRCASRPKGPFRRSAA